MIQDLTVGLVCLILKTLISVSRSAFGFVNARLRTANSLEDCYEIQELLVAAP